VSYFPEDRYIQVGPYNVRYWASGREGPALVLVHGLGGIIENWHRNLGPLSAGRRVYAVDLPGFGRSDKTPLVDDLNALVAFLGDFLDAVGVNRASFAGNSLGGGLILQFAARHPERTEKLVLVANAGFGRDVLLDLRACALPLVGEYFTRPSQGGAASLWKKILYDTSVLSQELFDVSYELYCLPGAQQALLHTLRAGINVCGQRKALLNELWGGLRTLPAPVLITWGRQDRILPVKHAEVGKRLLPDAEVYVFDECGHMPMLEHADEFNEIVTEFLLRPSRR
jgi:pimeloyl-ACP methyl ester carboxylesterase